MKSIECVAVTFSRAIRERMDPVLAQLRKDHTLIFLHTEGEEMAVGLSSLVSLAVEILVDWYAPIDSTPALRTAEHLADGCCCHCGQPVAYGVPPHQHHLALTLKPL